MLEPRPDAPRVAAVLEADAARVAARRGRRARPEVGVGQQGAGVAAVVEDEFMLTKGRFRLGATLCARYKHCLLQRPQHLSVYICKLS